MPEFGRMLLALTLMIIVSISNVTSENVTTISSATTQLSPLTTEFYSSSSSSISPTPEFPPNELQTEATATSTISMQTNYSSTTSSKMLNKKLIKIAETPWECPNITKGTVECSCDFPHTLRCTGDRTALQV